jgi:flavodoxin
MSSQKRTGFWSTFWGMTVRPWPTLGELARDPAALRNGVLLLLLITLVYTLILAIFISQDYPAAAPSVLSLSVEEQHPVQIWYRSILDPLTGLHPDPEKQLDVLSEQRNRWRLDMRALIVYDSVHGNTAQIAQAICDVLDGEVSVCRAGEVKVAEVEAVDLLIVGSPTHGGWFTEAIKTWLEELPATGLHGVRLAAFDTRTPPTWLSCVFGFAAPRIADRLEKKGGGTVGAASRLFGQRHRGAAAKG